MFQESKLCKDIVWQWDGAGRNCSCRGFCSLAPSSNQTILTIVSVSPKKKNNYLHANLLLLEKFLIWILQCVIVFLKQHIYCTNVWANNSMKYLRNRYAACYNYFRNLIVLLEIVWVVCVYTLSKVFFSQYQII